MKKSLIVIFAAALGLVACKNEKSGPGGLLYTIHKSEGKPKIKEGDFVKVDFIQKNDNDSIYYSTYDVEMPKAFPVQKKTYAGDMNDVMLLFGEGDSVTFRLNIDTMIKHTNEARPEQFKKDKYINFTVKIHKVFPRKANEADSTFQKRVTEFFQTDYKNFVESKKKGEGAKINKYIADNKLKVTRTPSGLQYVINAPGSGVKPQMGDTVMVNYTGKLTFKKMDGKDNVFDTSVESIAKANMAPNPAAVYGPRPIALTENVSKGFVEAVRMLGKGGKITAIVPSALGYGEQGMGPIGPYSPMVFDIELVDIKKGPAPIATSPLTAPKK